MLSGYFHFGNSHVLVKFSLFKDMCQMLADSWYAYTKQLCHRLLRSPYCFVLYHYLYPAFFIRQLVQYELYLVVHLLFAKIINYFELISVFLFNSITESPVIYWLFCDSNKDLTNTASISFILLQKSA